MNTEFRRKLAKDLEGLTYPSTNGVEYEVLDAEDGIEFTFAEFFKPLIKKRPSMSEEQRQTVERYRRIKGFIAANVRRKRVYMIATGVDIEILICGTDLSGAPVIIRTKAKLAAA